VTLSSQSKKRKEDRTLTMISNFQLASDETLDNDVEFCRIKHWSLGFACSREKFSKRVVFFIFGPRHCGNFNSYITIGFYMDGIYIKWAHGNLGNQLTVVFQRDKAVAWKKYGPAILVTTDTVDCPPNFRLPRFVYHMNPGFMSGINNIKELILEWQKRTEDAIVMCFPSIPEAVCSLISAFSICDAALSANAIFSFVEICHKTLEEGGQNWIRVISGALYKFTKMSGASYCLEDCMSVNFQSIMLLAGKIAKLIPNDHGLSSGHISCDVNFDMELN